MIVIARKLGRLGNRLILFSHFIAHAQERGLRVVNPAFVDYASYFRGTCDQQMPSFPPGQPPESVNHWRMSLNYRLTYAVVRGLAGIGCTKWPLTILRRDVNQPYDLAGNEFSQLVEKGRTIAVQGWLFRDHDALHRQADLLRNFFQLVDARANAVQQVIADARGDADVLIGVHIRKGDYAKFQGGKFFFESHQYRQVMEHMAQLLAPQKVAFLICSDAAQDVNSFQPMQASLGSGHEVEDMYALAGCDYLLGPPSTYTAWASFYGQVPKYNMNHADATFSLQDFSANMGI